MVYQIVILFFLASFCLVGTLFIRHVLNLPFRATNDALHRERSAFTLDFLIPGGTHIDDKMTIGTVLKTRINTGKTVYQRMFKAVADLVPAKYRLMANLMAFCFWSLLFMSFFRLFTFMGYGRAFRGSLFLGGLTYYFMPDFTPGRADDVIFIAVPAAIILIRWALRRDRKTVKK